MDDIQIIDLYFQRSEEAIQKTDTKYGRYCFRIANNILANREDSQESVNDTYLAAWNAMPPHRPPLLAAFLGKLTRNISIDRRRSLRAEKRGGGEFPLCLEELADCVSGSSGIEDAAIARDTVNALNRFLRELPDTQRSIFLRRYWYMDSVRDIAEACGLTQTGVTTLLHRIRRKLRKQLEQEGLL